LSFLLQKPDAPHLGRQPTEIAPVGQSSLWTGGKKVGLGRAAPPSRRPVSLGCLSASHAGSVSV